jgi:hypothetical protein
MSQRKPTKAITEVEKITFRLWPPYTERVAKLAEQARLNPNQVARLAIMAMADGGLLDLSGRLNRIEETLIRFRHDFNSAVDSDEH